MNSSLLLLIINLTTSYHLDPMVVMDVIRTESNYNTNAVGTKGELGLMQLLPSSFPEYTSKQLLNPKLNIKLGIKHLYEAKKSCIHQVANTFIICYNKGTLGGSRIKYPFLDPYYKRVMFANNQRRKLWHAFVIRLIKKVTW